MKSSRWGKGPVRFILDFLVACLATLRGAFLAAREHWITSSTLLVVFVLLAVFAGLPLAFFVVLFLALLLARFDGYLPMVAAIVVVLFCALLNLFATKSTVTTVVIWAYAFLVVGVLLELVRAARETHR